MGARLIAFGEVMARLSPSVGEVLGQSAALSTYFGGAEANAAATFAQLGGDAAMITTLPASALGRGARAALAARGVSTNAVRMVDRGRLGLYFATYGAGIQPPEVLYDRAHSSFALDPTPHDAAAILKGATYLHITGITPALSSAAAKAALDLAHQAVEAGVTVSFDANYRATLWQSWGGDGPSVLRELLTMASIAFVDHRDLALLLDKQYRGVDSSEKNAIAFADAFAAFPRLEIIATTQREVVSMSHHNIAACGQARGAEIIFAPPISISKIIDRIGGGDAFAGALLVELSRKAQIGDALAVALTACAIKHGQCGDMIAITPESLRRAKTSPLADIQR